MNNSLPKKQIANDLVVPVEFHLLCFDIDNICHFQGDPISLLSFISSNRNLFPEGCDVKADKLKLEYVKKDVKIELFIDKNADIGSLINKDYYNYFSIRILFFQHKMLDRDFWKFTSDFRKRIINFLSNKGGFQKIYITRDDYSKKALTSVYNKFYVLENLLRSYVTKRLSTREGVKLWFKNSIKRETQEKIRNRKNNENVFADSVVDTDIFLIDFDELGSIIYDNSYGNLNLPDLVLKVQTISSVDGINNLQDDLKKYIDKYFTEFKDVNFQEKWEKLKKYRNKIAHNSLTDFEETEEAQQFSQSLIDFLKDKDKDLTYKKMYDQYYVDIERGDVDTTISSTFITPTKGLIIKELSDYSDWCRRVNREFLGLKNFIKNWVGPKDINRGITWDLLEELENEGYIKISIWKDPNKKYPNQKEIKIIKKLPL
jgi:hypothetical protein